MTVYRTTFTTNLGICNQQVPKQANYTSFYVFMQLKEDGPSKAAAHDHNGPPSPIAFAAHDYSSINN